MRKSSHLGFRTSLWVLGALGACSCRRMGIQDSSATPSSQETYEYGNCPKYDGDCPREGTLACALKTIVDKYNSCSKHEGLRRGGLPGEMLWRRRLPADLCQPSIEGGLRSRGTARDRQVLQDCALSRLRAMRCDRYHGGLLREFALHLDPSIRRSRLALTGCNQTPQRLLPLC